MSYSIKFWKFHYFNISARSFDKSENSQKRNNKRGKDTLNKFYLEMTIFMKNKI
jgi:hypothetical protein